MEPDKVHLRHCMLYEFKQGKNASQAAQSICNVYGIGVLTARTVPNWFARFRDGNFTLEDDDRSGRPVELETDELEALLEEDPRQSTRELGNRLGVDHSTVLRRLDQLGKINKLGKWVPHKLSENNVNQRLTTCISHLARYKKKDFLWKIVTGDEKWIYFNNPSNKRQWLDPGQASVQTPKRNIHGKKVMLCVWWDIKGILYFELLQPKQTVNAQLYSQQLTRLDEKIREKRTGPGHGNRKVILLHDNARPHVAIKTKETIIELGWEVMTHPAYSPDLAPSDYYLFRSLEHSLREKSFSNVDDLKNHLDEYFESKPQSFYRDGIRQLPIKWAKVIDNNGNYFED